MATLSTHFCTLCQEDDVSTPAVSWCLECEDWLCSNCEKHHGRSRTSKHHKTIGVDEYDKLPPFVLQLSKQCPEHNHRFEHFCSFHGVPCCVQCISKTHKECDLNPLVDVLQNIKESAAIFHLEEHLNDIQKNLEVVDKHLLDRLSRISDQKKECLNEIKRVRTSVNEHLDKIERNILDELSMKEKDLKKTIESLMSQIESKKRRVVHLQESLLATKRYATDLHIFLCMKDMEKQMSEESKYIEDLEKEDHFGGKSLELAISPAVNSLSKDIVEFGKILIKSSPSTLQLTRTSQGQAQQSLPRVSAVDKVNPVKTITINYSKTAIVDPQMLASVILPTGEYVFADYNNSRLVLCDSKGTYVRDVVQMSCQPSDMCYIKDKIVGVSFVREHKIEIIDVYKSKIVKTIKMKSDCYGIDCYNDQLFVRVKNVVVSMDLDGKIKQSVTIPEKNITSIAYHKNYIYCTNWKTDEVLCYDMNGKMVWKHKYEALRCPQSITIDKRLEIIFVVGTFSNTLLAISLDGNESKIVLSDGLDDTQSVCVNAGNTILVCNRENEAFVYKL